MKIEAVFVCDSATTEYSRSLPRTQRTEHRLIALSMATIGREAGPQIEGSFTLVTKEPIESLINGGSIKATFEIEE